MNESIETQVIAIRIACTQLTAPRLKALQDSVELALRVPAACPADRKAAAHADLFNVLADGVTDPAVAAVLSAGAILAYDLMTAASCDMTGMIAGSRRRLLEHLLAGDAQAAAREMENHLRVLHYLRRLRASA